MEPLQSVRHKVIAVTINKLFRPDMTAYELYEATRGVWRVGEKREEADYVFAVYQGIVQEVYRVKRWFPIGTFTYTTRTDVKDHLDEPRWEFEGEVATDIRAEYLHTNIGKGSQNPVRYYNVD